MFVLELKDNDENISYHIVKSCKINISGNVDFVLQLENETIQYRISKDSNENSLIGIQNYITSMIKESVKNNQFFCISEYSDRNYIYIGDGNDIKKFTAIKK